MATARMKRVSIGGLNSPQLSRLRGGGPGDPTLSESEQDLDRNDDNAELLLRKQNKVLELNQNISPLRSRRRLSQPTTLSNSELADQYANCIKLSTENKITIRNAFGLHLIDYMAMMVKKKDPEMSNFQVASCTLDASTKIYACRVDCVHTETFKIAGGLAKPTRGRGSTDQNDVEDMEVDQGGAAVGKKSKKKNLGKTIEPNVNALNINKLDLQLDVNPLFQKMTTMFAEGRTDGVLLNSLHCRSDGCELLLDSLVRPGVMSGDSSGRQMQSVEISDFKTLINDSVTQAAKICPIFADFMFGEWTPNKDEWNLSQELERIGANEEAMALEDDGKPETDDDDDGNDVNNDGDDAGNFPENPSCSLPRIVVHKDETLKDLQSNSLYLNISSHPSEYSYFDEQGLLAWAGPNHWRALPRSRDRRAADTGPAPKTKERQKVTSKRISYEDDDEVHLEPCFERPRQSITLAPSTVENWNQEECTLPEDLHYDAKRLLQLFLKPAYRIKLKCAPVTESNEPLNEYDYNNPNDVENFIPAASMEEGATPPLSPVTQGFPDTPGGQSESQMPMQVEEDAVCSAYAGDNLVQQPFKLAKLDIPFARINKKINIKRLKAYMWNVLTHADRERNSPAEKEHDVTIMEGEMKFKGLCEVLLKAIPQQMVDDYSDAIAFVGLLHLANEKNLKLIPQRDFRDFVISQCNGPWTTSIDDRMLV